MRKDYGKKYVCFSCAAKFYDLGRPQAICPICETDQDRRPKKKDKRGLRSYEAVKPLEQPQEIEAPDPSDNRGEAPLIDTVEPDVDDGIKDGTALVMEEEED